MFDAPLIARRPGFRSRDMSEDDPKATRDAFRKAVNMAPKELEDWLQTDESQDVGQKNGGGESTGHESGRRIVEIFQKKKSDYTEEDLAHMKKVNGYVRRHLEQKPNNDLENSRWRYSLMNWGHDPLK